MNEVTRIDPLDAAENEIALLREFSPITPDEIILLRNRLAEFKRRASELLNMVDERLMVPYVKTHGEIVIGPGVKWVMKIEKTVKVRDLRQAIEGLYAATNGDFDAFVQCLSVNALKPGECRKVLGGRFDALFETVVREDVELKQPKKVLALVNDNFTR